jgi:hypothetical protein
VLDCFPGARVVNVAFNYDGTDAAVVVAESTGRDLGEELRAEIVLRNAMVIEPHKPVGFMLG